MTKAEKWFNERKAGELLTQISKFEFHELLQEVLSADKLNIEALFGAEGKKERIRARKILCVSNLCQSPPKIAELLRDSWKTLYFRKREGGLVDVELRH